MPAKILQHLKHFKRHLKFQESGILIVILLIAIFLTFASDTITVQGREVNNFLRIDNLIPNIATPVSWMAIMAIGVTCVIISGGIDISVGSIFGCSALATTSVLQNFGDGSNPAVVIIMGFTIPLLVGGLAGGLNGVLITKLKMHPFIVTLGTMSILRGIALISVSAKSLPAIGKNLPSSFTDNFIAYELPFDAIKWMKLQPVPMILMIVCLLIFAVFLKNTPSGRKIYAVGGNEEAARFSGINVDNVKISVYFISGLTAGLAGMISAGYYGSANTATGEGYELNVIAAAVVGGASLLGGRGTALGAILGAIVIKLIENGIDIIKKIDLGFISLSISKEYSKIIIGAAIIIAVAVDRLAGNFKFFDIKKLKEKP